MGAVLDITINEGDTFIMVLELWDDVDNTLPTDISADDFKGTFKFGNLTIPMNIKKLTPAVNAIEASVQYTDMRDLPRQGRYDIDQLPTGESFRLLEGAVQVSKEITQ